MGQGHGENAHRRAEAGRAALQGSYHQKELGGICFEHGDSDISQQNLLSLRRDLALGVCGCWGQQGRKR